jgi:periplasmic protein TonB
MFNTLLESKPKKEKMGGGTVFSIILHSALIVAAVAATATAAIQNEKPKAEEVKFVEAPKEPPPPEPEKPPPPPDIVAAPPPPKGFQVLAAPIKIPDVIPDIDLTKKVTDENDFSGKGAAGGTSKGVVGGTAPSADQPYFEFQVEKPVVPAPGNPAPRYPEMLKSSNIEGEVLAQFVVDTQGKAEMNTFKVLKSTHELFTQAVKNVLPSYKFLPAETGGRKVKQLVQLPFQFAISK